MSTDNISVAVKIRPFIQKEKSENLKSRWTVQGNAIVQLDEKGHHYGEPYSFDHIFTQEATNEDVYNSVVLPLVQCSMGGMNSTIFAYGQTSSGKTHTMAGSDKVPGIIELAVNDIFKHVQSNPQRRFMINCSYFEIYDEKIKDLLDKSEDQLKIREDYYGNTFVNAKAEVVTVPAQVFEVMKLGNKIKKIGCTNMNEHSSRSHTIFRFTIRSAENHMENAPVQVSQLNLVDLAGSERIAQTKASGARLKEGATINKSLLALGNVIRQLSENEGFVNYRDSKLTRLLQQSLGGNAKALIISTITIAAEDETKSTLEFAQRAKTIKNKPIINEILTEADKLKQSELVTENIRKKLAKEQELMKNMQLEKDKKEREIEKLKSYIKHIDMFMQVPQRLQIQKESKIPRRHTLGHYSQDARCSLTTIFEQTDYEEELTRFEYETLQSCDSKKSNDIVELIQGGEKSRCLLDDETIDRSVLCITPEPLENQSLFKESEISETPPTVLRYRLHSLEDTYESLKDFTRLEKECTEQENKMDKLLEHNMNLIEDQKYLNSLVVEERQEKEKIKSELGGRLEVLQSKLNFEKKRTTDIEFAYKQANMEIDKLKQLQSQYMNDQQFLFDQQRDKYDNQIKYLKDEIDSTNKKNFSFVETDDLLDTITKQNIEYQKDIKRLNETVMKYEGEISDLRQQLESSVRAEELLSVSIQTDKHFDTEKAALESEIKRLTEEEQLLKNDSQSMKKVITELEISLKKSESQVLMEIANKNFEICQSVKVKTAKIQKNLDLANTKIQEKADEYENVLQQQNAEVLKLKKLLKDSVDENKTIKEKEVGLEGTIKELLDKNNQLTRRDSHTKATEKLAEEKIESLQKDIVKNLESLQKVEGSYKELMSNHNTLKQSYKDIQEKLVQSEKEFKQNKEVLEEKIHLLNILLGELQTAELLHREHLDLQLSEITSLKMLLGKKCTDEDLQEIQIINKDNLKQLKAVKEKLMQQENEFKTAIGILEHDKKDLVNEKNALQELLEQHKIIINNTGKEFENTKEKLLKNEREFKAVLTNLKIDKEELISERNSLQKLLDQNKIFSENLKEELKMFKEELVKKENKFKDAIETLNIDKEKVINENKSLQVLLDQKEILSINTHEELEMIKEKLVKKEKEFKETMETYKINKANIIKENTSLQELLNQNKIKSVNTHEELKIIKEKLVEKEKEFKEAIETFKIDKEIIINEKDSLQQYLDQNKIKSVNTHKELEMVKEKLVKKEKQFNETIENLENDKEKLINENKSLQKLFEPNNIGNSTYKELKILEEKLINKEKEFQAAIDTWKIKRDELITEKNSLLKILNSNAVQLLEQKNIELKELLEDQYNEIKKLKTNEDNFKQALQDKTAHFVKLQDRYNALRERQDEFVKSKNSLLIELNKTKENEARLRSVSDENKKFRNALKSLTDENNLLKKQLATPEAGEESEGNHGEESFQCLVKSSLGASSCSSSPIEFRKKKRQSLVDERRSLTPVEVCDRCAITLEDFTTLQSDIEKREQKIVYLEKKISCLKKTLKSEQIKYQDALLRIKVKGKIIESLEQNNPKEKVEWNPKSDSYCTECSKLKKNLNELKTNSEEKFYEFHKENNLKERTTLELENKISEYKKQIVELKELNQHLDNEVINTLGELNSYLESESVNCKNCAKIKKESELGERNYVKLINKNKELVKDIQQLKLLNNSANEQSIILQSKIDEILNEMDEIKQQDKVLNVEVLHYIDKNKQLEKKMETFNKSDKEKCTTTLKEANSKEYTSPSCEECCSNLKKIERQEKLMKKHNVKIGQLQTNIFDLKSIHKIELAKSEDSKRILSEQIGNLEAKLKMVLCEKKNTEIQCDINNYEQLLEKYQKLKLLCRMRRDENNKLRNLLGLPPDSEVKIEDLKK